MKKRILSITVFLFVAVLFWAAYRYCIIPHRSFSDGDFDIETYKSENDRDNDGVDDQTDIVNSACAYIETEPKYKSRYYQGGYPDDGYGVCTDVVAQALAGAGYDLRKLVDEDIRENPYDYDIDVPDSNIDFRRVRNLKVYFEHTAISLTTDTRDIDEWQAGDIVLYKNHIGIAAPKRNFKGIPFLIHHANPMQLHYVEDVLEVYGQIVGHYRIS